MAIIYSYPLSTPKVKDLLIGTSTYDENADNPVNGNPTVSFTLQSVIGLIANSTGAQNLQQVTNVGNTTTNTVTISNDLTVTGKFIDSGGNSGTSTQVLSSTGTGTSWVPQSTGGLTGSGVATRVAFWSGTNSLTSDSSFYWDNTNKRLGVGTIFPAHILQVKGGNNADGPSNHRFQVTTSFTSTSNDNVSSPGIQLGYQNKSDVTYSDDNTYKTITPNLGVIAGGLGGIGGGATTITTATLGSNAYGTSIINNVTFADQSKTKIGMVVTYSIPTPNRVYGDGTAAQIYIMELDMPSGVIILSQSIYADAGATLHFSYPAGVGVKIYQPAVVDGTYDASSNYTWYDNPGWYQAARFDQFGGVGFGQGLEQGDTEIGTVTLAGAATRAGGEGITSGGLNPISSTKLKFINRYTDTPGTYQERQASISLNYVGSTYGDLELNPGTSLSKIKFVGYGSGNKTGTAAYNLSVDSSGKVIETANASGSAVTVANITITSSQLIALAVGATETPVTLIAAPGAGKGFNIQQVYGYLDAGTDAFNFSGVVAIQGYAQYGTGMSLPLVSFINETTDVLENLTNSTNFSGDNPTANTNMILRCTPNGGATTGTGTLYLSIAYKIIDIGPGIQAGF